MVQFCPSRCRRDSQGPDLPEVAEIGLLRLWPTNARILQKAHSVGSSVVIVREMVLTYIVPELLTSIRKGTRPRPA